FQREQIVPSIIVPAAKELILSPAIPQNLGSTNNLDETLVKYYQEGYMKDAAAEREIIKYEKRLLTERDANKLPSGSIVLLVKNNVVTPLAKDVIRSRKIELRVQGEESR
ncbi:MAG: microcompartment protein PduM, partial [Desulfitobacterium hafniense]|nr:microcompartment protein PduM [Desulfitobacterium hafniense]